MQRLGRLPCVARRHAGHSPDREPDPRHGRVRLPRLRQPGRAARADRAEEPGEQPLARRRRLLLEVAEQEGPEAWDIELPEFDYRRRWNLDKDGSLWIVTPGSVEQVGCIHTCQGLELDYVGVIIGPDLVYRDGRIVTDATKRASSDQSVKGLKKMLKADPESARALADTIVKNTYRTLMTRGMKGCYVYCTDAPLAAYLRSRLAPRRRSHRSLVPRSRTFARPSTASSNVMPCAASPNEERAAGVAAAPVDRPALRRRSLLRRRRPWRTAQRLGRPARLDAAAARSLRRPGVGRVDEPPHPERCMVPVSRESDGHARGQGRRRPASQHLQTPRRAGGYTVKIYASEKVPAEDGGWRHERITLRPGLRSTRVRADRHRGR